MKLSGGMIFLIIFIIAKVTMELMTICYHLLGGLQFFFKGEYAVVFSKSGRLDRR